MAKELSEMIPKSFPTLEDIVQDVHHRWTNVASTVDQVTKDTDFAKHVTIQTSEDREVIRLSDEQIRFYIENANDQNGKEYAELLYEYILDFSPHGLTLSPEYDRGELKLFHYENSGNIIVVKTIECTFKSFKALATASEADFKKVVDQLTINERVIDLTPKAVVVEDGWVSHLETLSPYEQRQYNEFLQNSY